MGQIEKGDLSGINAWCCKIAGIAVQDGGLRDKPNPGVLGNALDGVDMESKTEIEEDSPVEDTDAMTIDEKFEIEAKVADALEANFETHDMVARAHSGDNSDEESEDEMMQREEEEKSGEGIGSEEKMDTEVGNLELAWQMFELAKV